MNVIISPAIVAIINIAPAMVNAAAMDFVNVNLDGSAKHVNVNHQTTHAYSQEQIWNVPEK